MRAGYLRKSWGECSRARSRMNTTQLFASTSLGFMPSVYESASTLTHRPNVSFADGESVPRCVRSPRWGARYQWVIMSNFS
jgi:hypothetical protein